MVVYQKTIQSPVTVTGIGVHSGKPASITFKPAAENSGIYFVRTDLSGDPALKASTYNVQATQMATVLGGEFSQVSTVEHCMSAAYALEIDNLIVELDGPEVPILDGSAGAFFRALQEVGRIEQPAPRKYIEITKPIYFSLGDKYAYALPYRGFKLSCSIDFPHPKIGKQSVELDVNEYSFGRELSFARTFGFYKEVEYLQSKGLALGASLENAIGLTDDGIMNPEGLRAPDEFVRHKAMDAIGDLVMLGHPIFAHVVLLKSGHDVMHHFVQRILESKDSYRVIQLIEDLPTSLEVYPRLQFR